MSFRERAVRVRRTIGLGPGAAALLALLLGPGALVPAREGAAAPGSDQSCITCHASGSLGLRHSGKSLLVDAAGVSGSAHAGLACVDCHRDAAHVPHAATLARVKCGSCHAKEVATVAGGVHGGSREKAEQNCTRCHGSAHAIAAKPKATPEFCASCHASESARYRTSVHGMARARGDMDASTCVGCHGPAHAVRAHTDSLSTVSHRNLAETCARCHSDRVIVARRKITIPEAVQLFKDSVHGRSKNPSAATCNNCHESHDLRRAADPTSSIYRTNIPRTCGKCHAAELEKYTISVHGQALANGVTAAPVCTDCHGEHMIRGPREVGSPVAAGRVSETCSKCHEAEGIRQTFGLPAGRLSSYRDSYHGLAARGGSPAVANCASCHGVHDILPSSDPRSTVSPARLGETCGKCHPGASARFQTRRVHVVMTSADQPVLFMVRNIYLLLIVMTIGFMLAHQGLDFAGKIRQHLKVQMGEADPHAHALKRWFVRMTLGERIQHALLAVSFFTLVYTGFALKFPETWMFAWLARLEGGYAWRGIIHRAAAVVMITCSLGHVVYLFTRRGRRLLLDLLPRFKDAADLFQNLLHLVGLRREPPQFDRFGYIEKMEYWALIWGTVVMTMTGLMLWFENQSMHVLSKWMLDLATVVHYYEAWLAFLAIVVWHLYQNIVSPDVYPMNWTWLTGKIPEGQLRHGHYVEWAKIIEAESRAEEAARAAGEKAAAKEKGGGPAGS